MNNAKSWKTPIIDETARMNADIKCWFVMTIQKESVQKL